MEITLDSATTPRERRFTSPDRLLFWNRAVQSRFQKNGISAARFLTVLAWWRGQFLPANGLVIRSGCIKPGLPFLQMNSDLSILERLGKFRERCQDFFAEGFGFWSRLFCSDFFLIHPLPLLGAVWRKPFPRL
jgi:hypothetical protein